MTRGLAQEVIRLASGIFSFGLRLALPIVGLLLMTDITMALLGKLNGHLQMGHHAFPIKMLLTLIVLSSILIVTPKLYTSYADELLQGIRHGFLR